MRTGLFQLASMVKEGALCSKSAPGLLADTAP
jgi:hypothetical protein